MIIYIKKIPYYFYCFFRVFFVLKNPLNLIFPIFRKTTTLVFRDGMKLTINEPMQILLISETLLDDVYGVFDDAKHDSVFVDIGAAIGDLTTRFGYLYPKSTIVGVEPSLRTFALLSKNTSDNNLKNVKTINKAVGAEKKYILNLSSVIGCDTLSDEKNMYEKQDKMEKIEGITLSEIFETSLKGKVVDFLKIDCEGAELDIIKTIKEDDFSKIRRIAIEYHNHITPNEDKIIAELLKKHGFKVSLVKDKHYEFLGYLFAKKG